MSDVRLAFTMTEAEYVAANRFMLTSRREMRALVWVMAVATVIRGGLSLIAKGGPEWSRIAVFVAGWAVVVALVWLTPWLQARQLKGHSTAFVPQAWTFSDAGSSSVPGAASRCGLGRRTASGRVAEVPAVLRVERTGAGGAEESGGRGDAPAADGVAPPLARRPGGSMRDGSIGGGHDE